MIGFWEWIMILVLFFVAFVIFGKKFKKDAPDMARSAGESIREFKEGFKGVPKATKEFVDEVKKAAEEEPKK